MQICQFSLWFLFSLHDHYIVMLLNNFLADEWKISCHCLQCLTTLTLQLSIFCMIKTSLELHKFDQMFVFYHFGYHIPLWLSILIVFFIFILCTSIYFLFLFLFSFSFLFLFLFLFSQGFVRGYRNSFDEIRTKCRCNVCYLRSSK